MSDNLFNIASTVDPMMGAIGKAAPLANLIVPGAGVAIGALGNVYAGYQNAKAVAEKKAMIGGMKEDSDLWYNQNYNQDQMGTNVAKAALEKARENLLKSNQQAENTAAVTGATTENVLASKTKNQEQYGNVLSNLSAMGTARQDRVDSKYRDEKMKIAGLELGELDADIGSAQTMQKNSGNLLGSSIDIATFLAGGF